MSSSDDEAPEEITLAVGKTTAAAQKKQERESARLNTKKRRRPKKASDIDVAADGEDEADLLPADVLSAVAAKSRQQQGREPAAAAGGRKRPSAEVLHELQQEAKRKLRKVEDVRKGPVVVKVLGAVDVKPSAEAAAFLKQQLSRRKRSADMLQPARSLHAPPTKFATPVPPPPSQAARKKKKGQQRRKNPRPAHKVPAGLKGWD